MPETAGVKAGGGAATTGGALTTTGMVAGVETATGLGVAAGAESPAIAAATTALVRGFGSPFQITRQAEPGIGDFPISGMFFWDTVSL